MHLAIAVDFNYLTPFYVLITSVLYNNRDSKIHFHVAVSEIPESELQNITRYVQQKGGEISFYDAAAKLKGMTLQLHTYFTAAAYYRIILAMMVPDSVEKLLYLDVDTVVISSLKPLFDTNLGQLPAGAVNGIRAPRPDLGIHDNNSYFNSGVLLINLSEWRKQNISQKALTFIRENPEKLKWMDQCALNAVLAYNYYKLPKRFNIRHNDIPADLPPRRFNNFLADKVIIHYTSSNKPWVAMGRNRLRFLYHHYLKLSPRSNEKRYADFKLSPHLLYRFLRIRFVEMLANYPILLRTARNSKKYQKRIVGILTKAVFLLTTHMSLPITS